MKKHLLIPLCIITVFASCVSKKRLHKEESKVDNLRSDSTRTHASLNDCNKRVAGLDKEKSDLEKEKADVQRSLMNLSSSSQATIENSKMTIAEQAKRLNDLQSLIQSQKNILNKLKKTMADALINFKPDELSVELKDGKLYVSLQEKLLFKSGSAEVDPKGKDALKKLAAVLNTTPDISIMIEGHTDNVPVSGKYQDNWALSTARATSIVRFLTVENKVDSHTIIASGRAEFYPVADNATVEGKSKNRRTEIILTPDLKELFKLINQ